MKIKLRGVLAALSLSIILTGLVLPGNSLNPRIVSADPGIMRWDTVSTPNSVAGKHDVLNPYIGGLPTGSEVRDLAIGSDGKTLLAAVTVDGGFIGLGAGPTGILMVSNSGGIAWSTTADRALRGAGLGGNHVYNAVIAPDDPKFWIVTAGTTLSGPTQLWVTVDAGVSWNNTNVPLPGAPGEAIAVADISVDYGNGRNLMLVTRSGVGNGRLFIMKDRGFGTWTLQVNPIAPPMDYYEAKFSPTFTGDNSVIVVYSDATATYYNIGLLDTANSTILTWAFTGNGIEVKTATALPASSPSFVTLASACLSLPADFSGQSASLRRAFVSLNVPLPDATNVAGIYRIDDQVPAMLMPAASPLTQVYSIAFFGTYASGKLMAGMVSGMPCIAAVGTLFADTPCTCAGSCLYTPLKPVTGAGNQGGCVTGIGAAIVGWNPDGSLAYAVTGSGIITNAASWWNVGLNPWITTLIPNDETALSISRNNGETWNQLSLIDTTIDWFNDVAVSADCTTIYLASVNRNTGGLVPGSLPTCNEFDSVWRSTVNPAVAAPLPAVTPLGTYWERVMTHTTSVTCNVTQTDLPILRTVTSCAERSDGGVVAWAARFAPSSTTGGGLMAWSPDYGDYWMVITPRNIVGDFTFDTSRLIYNLSPFGMVQKLVYTGTSWTTSLPSTDTGLGLAHTIAASNGKVLVGGAGALIDSGAYPAAYSADSGQHWLLYRDRIPDQGREHVIFDVDFKNNSMIYIADDNGMGAIYRNTVPNFTRWNDNNMMDISNQASGPDWWGDGYSQGAGDPPHRVGYYGIVQAYTGNPQPALYGAHENITTSLSPAPGTGLPSNSGVCRTLEPRNGMPKPGVYWDCLDIFAPATTTDVHFTLEPSSLKACGCCTLDTNTTLWAIDNESGWIGDNFTIHAGHYLMDPGYAPDANRGMLWAYTDCLAKKGPAIKAPVDGALVGADPVSGRNQQIDLSWEQLCLSTCYEIQVAKDNNFTLRVIAGAGGTGVVSITGSATLVAQTGAFRVCMDDVNMTRPAAWIAPAGLPEAGAIYYWRVRSYLSATQQIAVSPWSATRSFTVKPGFIVNTPYYGVQLLAPNNGCVACKVKPVSFSWSPWKEATRYEFVIAKDAGFTQVIKQAVTSTTGYEYDGMLDYSTNYFWRVRATEVNGQPIPSDWSAAFSFQTEPQPAEPPPAPGEPATPFWVWVVMGTGLVLVILTMVLIIRSSRRI